MLRRIAFAALAFGLSAAPALADVTVIGNGLAAGCSAAARSDFDAALRIEPTLAEALTNRGAALIGQGHDAQGIAEIDKGLALMNKALEGKDYVAGKFSVADAALFYVEFWAAGRMKMELPKNCAAHYERMKSRPAVKRALEQEGLAAAA